MQLRYQRDVSALIPDLTDAAEQQRVRAICCLANASPQGINLLFDQLMRRQRAQASVRLGLAARRADCIVQKNISHAFRRPPRS